MNKSKNAGVDSKETLNGLFKQSYIKFNDLIQKQYSLHYGKSKKINSSREIVEKVQSIPPHRENKSTALMATTGTEPDTNQSLVNRIEVLRKEVEDLRDTRSKAETVSHQNISLRQQNEDLQNQYDQIKANLQKIRNDLELKDNEIIHLSKDNDKLSDKIIQLKTDYNQNKSAKSQETSDMLKEAKKQCQNQISSLEKDYDTKFGKYRADINSKEKRILGLEDKLANLENTVLPRLEQESQHKLAKKSSEIQSLTLKIKELKGVVDDLTNDKEASENQLKRTQGIVKDLKQNLKTCEDEKESLCKEADEQTTIANSLYEDRLNEKNSEIEGLTAKIKTRDNEISKLKENIVELDTKLCDFENKTKEIRGLVQGYTEKETGKPNPTMKIILDELNSLLPSSGESMVLSDKANQIGDLLREKDKLENQIDQLKWDIDKEIKQSQKAEQDNEKLQRDLSNTFQIKIDQLSSQLREKEELNKSTMIESDKLKATIDKQKEKFETILKKYRTFAFSVCDLFKYQESFDHEEENNSGALLTGLLGKIRDQNSNFSKVESELTNLKEKLKDAHDEISDKTQQMASLAHQIETLRASEAEGEGEEQNLKKLVDEKNEIISNHTKTLENMRSTILKLRDNLQSAFDEIEDKKKDIQSYNEQIGAYKAQEQTRNIEKQDLLEQIDKNKKKIKDQEESIEGYIEEIKEIKNKAGKDQKDDNISLLLTINSHLVAAGVKGKNEDVLNEDNPPNFEKLLSSVMDKVQNISLTSSIPQAGTEELEKALESLENQNKSLTNQLRDFKDTLDKKEKDFKFISKQRDNLRQQLESAVSYINSKDTILSQSPSESDPLPSLQSQLHILQDESKTSEVTRDLTEQIIDNFERNDRLLKEKLESMASKLKAKNSLIKQLKSELKNGTHTTPDQAPSDDFQEYRAKVIAEVKKKIREEEVAKRDKEIDRQRRLMSEKSEDQAIQFNQKIEELEAKFEAKDTEATDLLIKLQEAEHEVQRLRHSKERKSVLSSLDEQLDELSNTPKSKLKNQGKYEDQMKVLEKIERLDEKIIDLTDKISMFKSELSDRIETELEEINNYFTSSTIIDLGDKTMAKLQKMKEANMVVQIVRKINTEGYNWLLLEKKDPLDKPLELKTSQSLSKSSMEYHPPGRKLFWVCEEALKEDLVEYVYSYTPAFLLESNSIKIEIRDLFNDESDYKAYNLLQDTTKELMEKRMEIIKDSREIRLGLRRENFLLNDAITIDVEDRLRDLENKNLEYEEEIQSISEENVSLSIRNKELTIFINLLNTRLRELNHLIYDFARDKTKEEYIKTNANLIRDIDQIKGDKLMLEGELKKIKSAIERQKSRKSNPKGNRQRDQLHSPNSFIFDGEVNELFDDSLIIDSSNKEYEEKVEKLEGEIRDLHRQLVEKHEQMEGMQATIDDLESESASKLPEIRKSESFEMMNSDNIKHIKDLLLKYMVKVPFTDPGNEALFDILLSMLHMKEPEKKDVKEAREKLTAPSKNTPNKEKKQGNNLFSKLFK